MDREIEIAAVASVGGWLKRKPKADHVAPAGTPCANCATPLVGPYCHQCGQLAENFHRSLGHLVEETVENLLHLDGRLWTTLPRLIRKPAELTRDYLDGHRAGQIPPLRLFLVVVLLFFFAGDLGHQQTAVIVAGRDPAKVAEVKRELASGMPVARAIQIEGLPKGMDGWLKKRMIYAANHQHEFSLIMEGWAHRLAILLLPASALMLGLLFAAKRKFLIYDHLIFSMHSLSFMGLLLSAKDVVSAAIAPSGLASVLLLAMPVHLFVHMRGVYGVGAGGALVRMALLFLMTVVVLIVGAVALVAVGLTAIPAEGAA